MSRLSSIPSRLILSCESYFSTWCAEYMPTITICRPLAFDVVISGFHSRSRSSGVNQSFEFSSACFLRSSIDALMLSMILLISYLSLMLRRFSHYRRKNIRKFPGGCVRNKIPGPRERRYQYRNDAANPDPRPEPPNTNHTPEKLQRNTSRT